MKNQFIELYRFILILWIVAFHYTTRYSQLYPDFIEYPYEFNNGGNVGVFVFFIISGYFYAYSLNKIKLSNFVTTLKFIINKYWRLFPAYLISIILIFIIISIFGLEGRNSTILDLLGNLLIWHPYCDYIDGAHWFIASLLEIQIIIAFIYFICKSNIKLTICIPLFCLMFICMLYARFDKTILEVFKPILDMRNMLIFMTGMMIWLIDKEKVKSYFSIVVLFILTYFAYYGKNIYILLHTLIFVMFLGKQFLEIKINPIFITLGKVSFSWYLIHQNIGYIIITGLKSMGYTSEIFLLIPIIITLCLAFAIDYCSSKFPNKLLKNVKSTLSRENALN